MAGRESVSKGEEWGTGKCFSEASVVGREESEQMRWEAWVQLDIAENVWVLRHLLSVLRAMGVSEASE